MAVQTRPSSTLRIDQIVAATRRLFIRHGYRRTSMDDIATEASVAKATLYLHFSGKEAIFKAMIDCCRAQIETRLNDAERSDGPLQARLANLLYAYYGTGLEWFGDSSHLRELYAVVVQDPATFGPAAVEDQLSLRLDGALTAAIARGEACASGAVSVQRVCRVLMNAAAGAKRLDGVNLEDYRRSLDDAAVVAVAALSAPSD